MIALLDADIILYQAAQVGTTKVDWGDEGCMDVTNVSRALDAAVSIVHSWTKRAGCKTPWLIFSDRSGPKCTFRYRLHPIYKDTRESEKPPSYGDVSKALKNTFTHRTVGGLEGDDLMGLLATGDGGNKYVVVSTDKDMKTLPVRQLNPYYDDNVVFRQTLLEADRFWMYQTLVGDTIDNYKGCPGVGDKTATAALKDCKNLDQMWDVVIDLYEAQFKKATYREKFLLDSPEDEALLNARFARILRHGDFQSGKIKLWHPMDGYMEEHWFPAIEKLSA
jgi:5'-3' exonuclease